MKTLITDKFSDYPRDFLPSDKVIHADLARRLELDRDALMEALAKIARNPGDCDGETSFTSGHIARAALAAARANFPEP